MIPLGTLIAGPLAEKVFEPAIMKTKLPVLKFAFILSALIVSGCGVKIEAKNSGPSFPFACTAETAFRRSDRLQPNQGCSVIYATDGKLMLGGNNEDYFNPLTKVWFIPGEAGSFGRVYFGFGD
jgi:hypothetical protein